ncbi:protein-disulfide isomerase [Saccharothrix carnea]|uniref:Protein-disulfide isomerase n=1 Tax=Saccharothrix carnea TaxID=1280637 RepID=A0A2P8IG05_SACCR|nr:thioredoxin domain-containing protein [Saccharothrix carnea]PSL57405.1 protein-disulfide isomerase [Saccharothrix carnea]
MNDNRGKRRRAAAKTVAGARRAHGERKAVLIGVVVVAVLALVVVGGVLLVGSSRDGELAAPPGVTGIDAPVKRQGGTVVVGGDAPTTIDVYEDFLCPACGRFEQTHGPRIKQEIEEGELRVRYHLLPMLVRLSRPEGYSLDAANAALCAADQDRFWQYHQALFAVQPREGGPGHIDEELVDLGTELGISGDFARCVRNGTHDDEARAELARLQDTDFFTGTPAVTVDGEPVDLSDRDWLDEVLAAERGTAGRGSTGG